MSQTAAPFARANATTGPPRISIVGAGISGLILACLLHRRQIPFTIYEARNADTIGHNYGIELSRRATKVLRLAAPSIDARDKFRAETAVDRIVGGLGIPSNHTPKDNASFQAVDRDVRQWLVQRLIDNGIEIQWNHKLAAIGQAEAGSGAQLSFEGKPTAVADVVVDAGGLNALAFKYGLKQLPEQRLLPYATYYGTRKLSSAVFLDRYSHYFKSGNLIELMPPHESQPYISVQKVHLANKEAQSDQHTVELRWIYSRPAKEGVDPLFRPQRSPQEAKQIPSELFDEIIASINNHFTKNKRNMLKQFFSLVDLESDRILNWHLRIRVPDQQYFENNVDRGTHRVLAIGDAAYGYPILKSGGANHAMKQALLAAQSIESMVIHPNIEATKEYPLHHAKWVRQAIESVQLLRHIHGQDLFSKQEMRKLLGEQVESFWVDTPFNKTQTYGSSASSSGTESGVLKEAIPCTKL